MFFCLASQLLQLSALKAHKQRKWDRLKSSKWSWPLHVPYGKKQQNKSPFPDLWERQKSRVAGRNVWQNQNTCWHFYFTSVQTVWTGGMLCGCGGQVIGCNAKCEDPTVCKPMRWHAVLHSILTKNNNNLHNLHSSEIFRLLNPWMGACVQTFTCYCRSIKHTGGLKEQIIGSNCNPAAAWTMLFLHVMLKGWQVYPGKQDGVRAGSNRNSLQITSTAG